MSDEVWRQLWLADQACDFYGVSWALRSLLELNPELTLSVLELHFRANFMNTFLSARVFRPFDYPDLLCLDIHGNMMPYVLHVTCTTSFSLGRDHLLAESATFDANLIKLNRTGVLVKLSPS